MIRNYRSLVPVERSVSLIERELVRAKAQHIAKSYDEDGNIEGVMFQIVMNGMPLSFQLPTKWRLVFKMMMEEVKKPGPNTEAAVRDQAQRTAWKLLYEWVAIQVSMIKLDQMNSIEVFLPYLHDGKRTLYQRLAENKFKMLAQSTD